MNPVKQPINSTLSGGSEDQKVYSSLSSSNAPIDYQSLKDDAPVAQPAPATNGTRGATIRHYVGLFFSRVVSTSIFAAFVNSGANVIMPSVLGNTIGRIPVVGDWLKDRIMDLFTKAPVEVVDTLNYMGGYSTFMMCYRLMHKPTEEETTKFRNFLLFIALVGSSMLAGNTTRNILFLLNDTPEEGIVIPYKCYFPPLPDTDMYSEDIATMNAFASTLGTTIIYTGVKKTLVPMAEAGLNKIGSAAASVFRYFKPKREAVVAPQNPDNAKDALVTDYEESDVLAP